MFILIDVIIQLILCVVDWQIIKIVFFLICWLIYHDGRHTDVFIIYLSNKAIINVAAVLIIKMWVCLYIFVFSIMVEICGS